MALITETNKEILTKRITTYVAAGAIFLTTFAASVGAYNWMKHSPERKQHRIEARHLRVNAKQLDRALYYNDLNLAQQYLNAFQPGKDITAVDYIKFKTQLEQGLVLEDINRNSAVGRVDSAKLILSSHANLWTLAEKASIEKSILEQSEEGRFNNLLYVTNPSSKTSLCKEYISLFPQSKHLGDVTTYLIETELSSLAAKNYSITSDMKRATLVQLNELLESYKNNGAKLEQKLIDETWKQIKSDTIDAYVPATHLSELTPNMTVQVKTNRRSTYIQTYMDERNKSIPEGSFGKIVGISDDGENIAVVFEHIDKFYWSRDWESVSQYWKDDKKNVATFQMSEVYIGTKKLTSAEEIIVNTELDKTRNLLETYYVTK